MMNNNLQNNNNLEEAPLSASKEDLFMVCDACGEYVESEDDIANLTSNRFNTFLKDYDIYCICKHCYEKAKSIYRIDLELFINWLEEHDNRGKGAPISDTRKKLRKGFDLNLSLIEEDLDKYYEQLEKYAARSEDLVVWLLDRYNLDIDFIIQEFDKHKVQML